VAALGLSSELTGLRRAFAAQTLVGVNWGGPWLDGAKPIAKAWEQKTGNKIAWELHEGSSAAVATKIRATWPTVKYDLIAGNDPVIHIMTREGWLEAVDDVPSLRDIPKNMIVRDKQGRAMAVPHFAGSVCWGYRTDLVKEPITSLKDLLEPRFKGKVGLRDTGSWSGLPLVSMALEFGGNERSIDPAFDFLKELAKRGHVANVAKSGMDVINSMNLGDSAVTLAPVPEWVKIRANHPVKLLNRVPGSRSLKGFYTLGHWILPKGTKVALAKDFTNFFVSPENDEAYAKAIGAAPTNVKAKFDPALGEYFFAPGELDQYAYFCDFDYMSQNDQKWIQRFDLEIRPLLRG
jgi:putative spermidine/putrescine transport system substrate-binding protein